MNNFKTVLPTCTKFGLTHLLGRGTILWSLNREIHNTRWPPAAILKLTKTWMTPKPLVRSSPNLTQSFIFTQPRHRRGQKRNFSKSQMAADAKLKLTKNWRTSKRFVLYAQILFIICSTPGTSLLSKNLESHNPGPSRGGRQGSCPGSRDAKGAHIFNLCILIGLRP